MRPLLVVVGAVSVVAGLLVLASTRHARSTTARAPDASIEAPLTVEISGCLSIVNGPVCKVSTSPIHLWLPGGPSSVVVVATDLGPVTPSSSTEWPDGRTLEIRVPEGATRLEVKAGPPNDAKWSMRLAQGAPLLESVKRALAQRQEGHVDDAVATLESALATNEDDTGAVAANLARIEFARGHVDAAVAKYKQAIALRREAGRPSEGADDAVALSWLFIERGRFGEAHEALDEAAKLADDYPDGRVKGLYYEGLLAWKTGDLRAALLQTRAAEARAARLGNARLRLAARQAIAWELEDLGRPEEAFDDLRSLLASEGEKMSDCARAETLDNLGWAALLVGESDPRAAAALDALASIGDALTILRTKCPDANRLANALVNLAWAELSRGRLLEARRALAEARTTDREPATSVALFWHHLAGRVALASGAPQEALGAFTREGDLALAVGTPDDERVAAEDRADALRALGRSAEALTVLDGADALLDSSVAGVPLGEGRGTYLASRARSAAIRVTLLVRAGRAADGLRVARRTRARALAGIRRVKAVEHLAPEVRLRWEEAIGAYVRAREDLDTEAARDWELSADKLAAALARRAERAKRATPLLDVALRVLEPGRETAAEVPLSPRPGDLVLGYFPAEKGWLAFTDDGSGVHVTALGDVDPRAPAADLSREMLTPVSTSLREATRVRVISYGALRSVDVHALPWEGAPLVAHAVVEYPLDVEAPSPASEAPPYRALIVADPRGDLAAARAEASVVSSSLEGDPRWNVVLLRGESATGMAFRAGLQEATLLHYAGHGAFAGPDGVESGLPLASGGSLTAGDILALEKVPPFVLLFGCETGRDATSGAAPEMGLSNAFLAAGARAVISSTRTVDDSLAADLARELYVHLAASTPADLPAALRSAQLAVRARSPASDWSAFRALVP